MALALGYVMARHQLALVLFLFLGLERWKSLSYDFCPPEK